MAETRSKMLLEQIQSLVDAPVEGGRDRFLARIEDTLTDGYAAALALEAERLRLERRIGQVATELRNGDSARKALEISQLADRITAAAGDLSQLRESLRSLRTRHASVRAA